MESQQAGGGHQDPLAPPPAASNLPVPVLRRLVTFDPNTGQPMVTTAPMLTRVQITDAITASLALPYEPNPHLPGDSRYEGMTNLEVMLHKRSLGAARSGDTADSEALLDRVLGKPKTTAESVRVDVNYADYLKDVARKVAGAVADAVPQRSSHIVDAEVVLPTDPLAP